MPASYLVRSVALAAVVGSFVMPVHTEVLPNGLTCGKWTPVPSENVGLYPTLNSVASTPGGAWAVGWYLTEGSIDFQPLIEGWSRDTAVSEPVES